MTPDIRIDWRGDGFSAITNEAFLDNTTGWAVTAGINAAATSLTRVTADGVLGGVTTNTCAELVTTAVSGSGTTYDFGTTSFAFGRTYRFSVWLRSVSGTTSAQILIGSLGTVADRASSNVTITTSWVRYSVDWAPSAGLTDAEAIVTNNAAAIMTARICLAEVYETIDDIGSYGANEVDGLAFSRGANFDGTSESPGTCTITVTNIAQRYSPDYAPAPQGSGLITTGRPVLVRGVEAAVVYGMFHGTVRRIIPNPETRTATLMCEDRLYDLSRWEVSLAVSTSRSIQTFRGAILDDAGYSSAQRSLASGSPELHVPTTGADQRKALDVLAECNRATGSIHYADPHPVPSVGWRYTTVDRTMMQSASAVSRYRATVLATTPVGYWRVGEASGTVAAAEVGAAGTYVNAPTLGVAGLLSGDPNTAVTLNGTTQYVQVGSARILSGLANSTVAVWFSLPSAPASDAPLYCERGAGNDIYKLNVALTTGRPGLVYRDDAGALSNMAIVAPSGTYWGDGRHLAVLTKAGSTWTVYVDGVAVASAATAVSDTLTGTPVCAVGGDTAGPVYLAGTVDEPALWDRTLSTAEVANLYARGTKATIDDTTSPGVTGLSGYDVTDEAVVNDQRVTVTTRALGVTSTVWTSFDVPFTVPASTTVDVWAAFTDPTFSQAVVYTATNAPTVTLTPFSRSAKISFTAGGTASTVSALSVTGKALTSMSAGSVRVTTGAADRRGTDIDTELTDTRAIAKGLADWVILRYGTEKPRPSLTLTNDTQTFDIGDTITLTFALLSITNKRYIVRSLSTTVEMNALVWKTTYDLEAGLADTLLFTVDGTAAEGIDGSGVLAT